MSGVSTRYDHSRHPAECCKRGCPNDYDFLTDVGPLCERCTDALYGIPRRVVSVEGVL